MRESGPSPEEIWRKYDAMEARLSAPLSARMLELAGVTDGLRVLDLATGRGEPAIAAAHRVGPGGRVVGVDVSASMLAMARERADREGATNLELRVMDASGIAQLASEPFHSTLCRWGLMYMDSPVDALRGARRAMASGGKLVAAVWARPESSSWHSLPRRVLERHSPVTAVDASRPGAFRYSDPARLNQDLASAGFRVSHEEEIEVPVVEAESAIELIDWTRAFGMSRLLEGLPMQVQRAWEADFAEAAERLRTGGLLRLSGITRVVVAS